MVNLNVEITGRAAFNSELERFIGGLRDLSRYYPDVVDEFNRIQDEWFASQGNGSWAPLSPAYAAWKATRAPGAPLLVLTGALKNAQVRTQESSRSLTIEVDAPDYWIYHQQGTSKMPARPPYLLDETVTSALQDALSRGILSIFD